MVMPDPAGARVRDRRVLKGAACGYMISPRPWRRRTSKHYPLSGEHASRALLANGGSGKVVGHGGQRGATVERHNEDARAAAAQWQAGFRRFVEQCDRVLEIHVFDYAAGRALLTAALLGDDPAKERHTKALVNAIQRILRAAKTAEPILCMTCPREIRDLDGVRFCMVEAYGQRGDTLLMALLCPVCGQDVRGNAHRGLQQVFPGLRTITVNDHQAGHA